MGKFVAAAPAAAASTAATAATSAITAEALLAAPVFSPPGFSVFQVASATTALTSLPTLLNLGLTGAGTLLQARGSDVQSESLVVQARQQELAGRTEELRGRQQALRISQQRDRDLASTNAIFASRGIVTSSGTPAQAQVESRRQASEDIEIARFGGDTAGTAARITGESLRTEADATRTAGRARALRTVGSTLLDAF